MIEYNEILMFYQDQFYCDIDEAIIKMYKKEEKEGS